MAFFQRQMSDGIVSHGRNQLENNFLQVCMDQFDFFDMIAFAKVLKESVDRLFAAVCEHVMVIEIKLAKMSALFREMA